MTNIYPYPPNPTAYYRTFPECLQDITNKYGEKTAVTTYNRQDKKTERNYLQFQTDAENFGAAFLSHGYQGCHIAIIGENSYYWLVAYFAAAISGNVAVCVDVEQSDEILRGMINQAHYRL